MLMRTNYNMALLFGEGTTSPTKNDVVSEYSHLCFKFLETKMISRNVGYI